MEDLLLQPLEFAVLDIIANSHLTNPGYSFLTGYNADKLGFQADPKFPYVVAASHLDTADNDTVTMVLTVAIVIPFPDASAGDMESVRYFKAVERAKGHEADLLEILQWLTGRKKVNGRPVYDFDLEGVARFNLDYDPVLPNNDEMGGFKRMNKLIIIGMDCTFKGNHDTLCCDRFTPDKAGENWRRVVADFSGA